MNLYWYEIFVFILLAILIGFIIIFAIKNKDS
ncbi:hypothetical protein MB2181_00900 [Methylophilales bacterium HTCC2181]|uniref:Uncharacterized protein n=1 Tax=Methylophilales bacterium HTCC2181 TaxID=383631 RepID=A0P4X7_9PROT|nr:hypothetical protein MB2181_00900 [Methylophilales bacterium HTCC2181]